MNTIKIEHKSSIYAVMLLSLQLDSHSFHFPLPSVHQWLVWFTDQTIKPEELKTSIKGSAQKFGSSRDSSVKVADGALWHEPPLNRNENHSRLTPCQLQLFCSEITWHIISACGCKQWGEGKKKRIPVEKIITSLCHHPEGTLSVSVQ